MVIKRQCERHQPHKAENAGGIFRLLMLHDANAAEPQQRQDENPAPDAEAIAEEPRQPQPDKSGVEA